MRYWVFIKEKVDGPYDENSLVNLQGFTPDTLICSEDSASAGQQEWVKASAIFEFDEVPVEQQPASQSATQPTVASASVPTVDASILLDKINAISNEMFHLQERLDNMQHQLDDSLKKSQSLPPQNDLSDESDNQVQTITLSSHTLPDSKSDSKSDKKETPSYPAQAEPEEEEVVIRSALDSMYAGQLAASMQEDTFQDLLPQKTAERKAAEKKAEEQAVLEIGKELEFIPVTEEEQASLEEALITTPSADEAAKDALLNELTASPKEDVLDQIIQEHQAEKSDLEDLDLPLEPVAENATPAPEPAPVEEPTPAEETTAPEPAPIEEPTSASDSDHSSAFTDAALAAAGALAIGGAAAALSDDHNQPAQPAETSESEHPVEIATDKNQPDHLEPVLPAQEMPADVSTEPVEQELKPLTDLPSLKETDQPQEEGTAPAATSTPADIPAVQEPKPLEEPAEKTELPSLADITQPQPKQSETEEDAIEELVPTALAEDVAPEPEEKPTGAVTEKDLEDAFGPMEQPQENQPAEEPALNEPSSQTPDQAKTEEPVSQTSDQAEAEEPAADAPSAAQEVEQLKTVTASAVDETITQASNPNDLTEIELKEGSTYLISDFVPPAQVTDNVAEATEEQQPSEQEKKLESTAFQDMLAATITNQSTQPLPSDGLPEDIAATQVNLENTIQAKRGASLDIKTVPMVPEPSQTDRLDVNELTDINAQHGVKHSGSSKLTKFMVGGLVVLLLAIIAYVLLGFMNLLPANLNVLGSKKSAPATQPAAEFFEQKPAEQPVAQPQPSPQDQALSRVQNFPLPNGYTLKEFIESKHSFASAETISWTSAQAVEPDNYSITVKIPPENPQSFQTAYRFNYNTVTGLLEPTISDAKNLLDQAYGVQQTPAQPTVQEPEPAPAAAKKASTANTRRSDTAAKSRARNTTARRNATKRTNP